ncbi:MAG TPA: hypothetical protein VL295_01390 [Gemmatimonadales bacterium]|nr:hypothetical protein [Gemmatimonadales bacterium]
MALNDQDQDPPESDFFDQLAVFGSAIFGTICVVGSIGWYAVRHRSDPWTPTDFAKSGALLALGLTLLVVAFRQGRRHAAMVPTTPTPPVTWMHLLQPVVGGVGLIGKGIFSWRDHWVAFHVPFGMILSILAGAFMLLLAWGTVRQLNALNGWQRRPSLKDALDQIFPTSFIVAVLVPERWSDPAFVVVMILFLLLVATDHWERRRPTGPSL